MQTEFGGNLGQIMWEMVDNARLNLSFDTSIERSGVRKIDNFLKSTLQKEVMDKTYAEGMNDLRGSLKLLREKQQFVKLSTRSSDVLIMRLG
jgi:hypothetical protein